MTMRATRLERAWAVFVLRWILGFVYFFAGVHKLTGAGAVAFGGTFAASDGARFLPASLLMAVGVGVPFLEILLGSLLLIGLWVRPVLRALAALVILIAAGYGISGLLHPMGATAMNIAVVNTFILPRAALLIVLLMLPADDDLLSLERLNAWRSPSS